MQTLLSLSLSLYFFFINVSLSPALSFSLSLFLSVPLYLSVSLSLCLLLYMVMESQPCCVCTDGRSRSLCLCGRWFSTVALWGCIFVHFVAKSMWTTWTLSLIQQPWELNCCQNGLSSPPASTRASVRFSTDEIWLGSSSSQRCWTRVEGQILPLETVKKHFFT